MHHTSRQLDVSEILGGIVDEAVRALATPVIGDLQRAETTTEPPNGTPSTVIRFAGAEAAGGLDHDRGCVRGSFERRFGAWAE